jgi:hypothetical protein
MNRTYAMFSFRRRAPVGSRMHALFNLYESFFKENDAEARGKRLLGEWLSPEQRAQFDAHGYFEVVGCHTGTRYRIRYGSSANIEELDKQGRPAIGLCFVPIGQLVPGDVMLAQKIALETNEKAAIAVAKPFPTTYLLPR